MRISLTLVVYVKMLCEADIRYRKKARPSHNVKMSTPVNEKTVELDVTASMLNSIRRRSPTALALGYTIRYERTNGLDISIRDRTGTLLSFQFKKAYRFDGVSYWFYFNNNSGNDQHNVVCLSALAARRGTSVFYALPGFATVSELKAASPRFLQRTFFLDPLDIGPIVDGMVHRFEIDTRRRLCHIHSEEHKSVKLKTWKDLDKRIATAEIGVRLEEIGELLRSVNGHDYPITVEKGRSRSVRLRGLIF